ncbi:hypothetical protein LBMAG56_06710 [Verrucomicrobiota bacterium]|nr:hypothetical protein LBMAG56_06710 [Verrucomicrobiota bacterium]
MAAKNAKRRKAMEGMVQIIPNRNWQRNGGIHLSLSVFTKDCAVRTAASVSLSPFVPHGARETDALLVTAAPGQIFETTNIPFSPCLCLNSFANCFASNFFCIQSGWETG